MDNENKKSWTICLLPNGFNPVIGHAWMTRHLSLTERFSNGHVVVWIETDVSFSTPDVWTQQYRALECIDLSDYERETPRSKPLLNRTAIYLSVYPQGSSTLTLSLLNFGHSGGQWTTYDLTWLRHVIHAACFPYYISLGRHILGDTTHRIQNISNIIKFL